MFSLTALASSDAAVFSSWLASRARDAYIGDGGTVYTHRRAPDPSPISDVRSSPAQIIPALSALRGSVTVGTAAVAASTAPTVAFKYSASMMRWEAEPAASEGAPRSSQVEPGPATVSRPGGSARAWHLAICSWQWKEKRNCCGGKEHAGRKYCYSTPARSVHPF